MENGQWELFAINDNATNVKLGIKMSMYLKQYLCDIHNLEVAVKDTFKYTVGIDNGVNRCKAIENFTHKRTVTNGMLKKEAAKEN